MFIITKYKMFESNFSDDDIKLAEEINDRVDYIEQEYELIVKHRQPFGDTVRSPENGERTVFGRPVTRTSGSRYFDIWKKNKGLIESIGVYDISNREFILFYSEGKQLRRESYLHIKSENFFDQLERVHYYTFIES